MLVVLCVAGLITSDVFTDAEAFFAAQPNRKVIASSSTWVQGDTRDPRIQIAARKMREVGWVPDPAVVSELEKLSKEIEAKPPTSGNDPRVKRMAELSDKLSPPSAAAIPAENARQDAYDRETRQWVKSSGYEATPSWRGRMAMLVEHPDRDAGGEWLRIASIVEWTAANRFWAASYGRLLWTGGYSVRASIQVVGGEGKREPMRTLLPERTIVRDGKNLSQMHLGREGWYCSAAKCLYT